MMALNIIATRRSSPAIGKDPPLSNVPKDLRALIRMAIPDPQKALDFHVALDRHLGDLVRQGKIPECEEHIAETRSHLAEMVAEQQKQKSRARFSVVATYIAPAFVTIVARIITDHLPFG
ncbi:hypothetical protein [Rhizobium sp. BK456]|uniref:hypothetical protein n=1 Tax=Rhizobium sp. BK456 TaxID=2587007 RepID=UPI001618CBAE|nr:hypothetical protein [Rhizobium sp. BK456]MBB3525387.1 hypothetical protein [Rhizobium sp. BK456]